VRRLLLGVVLALVAREHPAVAGGAKSEYACEEAHVTIVTA
jgi:hypothetical protein